MRSRFRRHLLFISREFVICFFVDLRTFCCENKEQARLHEHSLQVVRSTWTQTPYPSAPGACQTGWRMTPILTTQEQIYESSWTHVVEMAMTKDLEGCFDASFSLVASCLMDANQVQHRSEDSVKRIRPSSCGLILGYILCTYQSMTRVVVCTDVFAHPKAPSLQMLIEARAVYDHNCLAASTAFLYLLSSVEGCLRHWRL